MLKNFRAAITEKINPLLKLKEMPGSDDMKNLKTLAGDEVGHIELYTGEKMEKVVFTELSIKAFNFQYVNCNLLPEWNYNIPRYSLNVLMTGDGMLSVDVDLYARCDLVMNHEYLDKYYLPLEETYKAVMADQGLEKLRLPQHWLRAMTSPYFIWTNAREETKYRVQLQYALVYLDAWLAIWKEEKPLSDAAAEACKKRETLGRTMIKTKESKLGQFVKLFGEKTTRKMVDGMI
jgi:hypothetical protein